MKRKSLIYINILLVIFIITALCFLNPKTELIKNILYKENNTIKDNYDITQVKLFAITLEAEGEHLPDTKTTPLTCKINVDRVTRIIYMDEDEELGSKSIVYKKPVGTLMEPTKKGYIFEMWTNKDNEVIDEKSIIDSTIDYPIYANWNIVVSNLTVNPNGGTWLESPGEQSFSMDFAEEKEIEDPTRVGYTFSNWEVTGADSTIDEKIFKMGTEDTTIKAIWNANNYKLTINPNGGSYKGNTSSTILDIKYDSVTDIENPTRKGYTFTGWTVSNGSLNGNKFTMNYTGDVTLTANWQVNNYKYIVYHNQQSPDGSAYNKVANDTITGSENYGTKITPKVNTYTGFISPSSKTLTIDVDNDPPTKNVVNYNYNRQRFNLVIDPNTGTWNGNASKQTISLLYKQTYNVVNPKKTGYNFTGWSKTSNNSTLKDTIFTMDLANTTLTANWKPKTYTLTYSVNQGNPISPTSKTITFDSAYGSLPTPTRTGYRFTGWYTSPSGGTKVDSSTIHRTDSNVTIYAHWSNTAPTTPTVSTTYANSGKSSNGYLKNGSETATLVIKSTDAEDKTPTITVKCTSGRICKSLTIKQVSTSTGQATYRLTSTDIGAGVLEIIATDKAGATSSTRSILYVYSEDSSTLVNANYTNTTYDSGWIEFLEGCYISNFTFEVKFASGHSNGSKTDTMVVYGMTESGREVVLYTWTGNMKSTLHASNLSIFNAQTEKIRQLRFYTYSPHDDCARSARITYSVNYTFDINLLDSSYVPRS